MILSRAISSLFLILLLESCQFQVNNAFSQKELVSPSSCGAKFNKPSRNALVPGRSKRIYPQQLVDIRSALSSSQSFLNTRDTTTSLSSFQKLVSDVETSSSRNSSSQQQYPRLIFVGGKGGVGKTTVSSSLAVELASSFENDLNVLIISTDPAHSLGDALDEDLRVGSGKPVLMTDPLTSGRLHACEIDPNAAFDEFRQTLSAFDIDKLSDALGVSPDLLESLGLREFSNLLQNPPPGLDELVALANVLDIKTTSQYDVVLVDTAPTGHTLRMLALPAFLDGLLGKLIALRMKLSGLASTLQTFFGSGGDEAAARSQTIDDAVNKLEAFRSKMSGLRSRLQDHDRTSFAVVTIPTKLGIAETERLIIELQSQNVRVSDVVINQCVKVGNENNEDANVAEASALKSNNYYQRRCKGQSDCIDELDRALKDVSATPEYRRNNGGDMDASPIALTKVPLFDVELVGVPALGYLSNSAYVNNPSFSHLMNRNNNSGESKVIICGGKGGVGKTTTSSALAVGMAGEGHKVALISTDPAHSLGDVFDMDLSGGKPIDCPLFGVESSSTDGELSIIEIDPSAALADFKSIVDKLVTSTSLSSSSGGSDLGSTMQDLSGIFDTLPAGTDEVVALAKIVNLVQKGGYDRVVLDTAPTGHTLRMLGTPTFIAELIDRVLIISDKVNSNAAIKMLLSSAASNYGDSSDLGNAAATAKSTLLKFQMQMYDLEDLFANARQTEFLVVTIPTELAVKESVRLVNDLTFEAPEMPIRVRNVVANQVLREDGGDAALFLGRMVDTQSTSIASLKQSLEEMNLDISMRPEITEVPYLDTEPRGVFGLKMLSGELLKEQEEKRISNPV